MLIVIHRKCTNFFSGKFLEPFDFVIIGNFSYQAFINTELYARVSVAVLFHKLADLACIVGSPNEHADCIAALESGRSFLLELLDSAVGDYY